MKKNKTKYNLKAKLAAIFMIMTLVWLTISIPFVYAAQQQQSTYAKVNAHSNDLPDSEDSSSNPFGNTTEEKAESGSSSSLSEYLHDMEELTNLAGLQHKHDASHDVSVYVAFHGEMLCPPPNFILS